MEGITQSRRELLPKEIGLIAKAAHQLGVREFKITGGEPLLRDDIIDIVKEIRSIEKNVSMTTNGVLLKKYAAQLVEAGIHHVNVSLHSLDLHKFYKLTGGNLKEVLEGIDLSLNYGLPLKINVVILRQNYDEIFKIIDYSIDKGIDVNLIQLMPIFYFGGNGSSQLRLERHRRMDGNVRLIEEKLSEMSSKKYVRELHNRPVYVLPEGIKVTVIKGYGNPFACMSCRRMRITPDGRVMTCLYKEEPSFDLKPFLEANDIEGIKSVLRMANSYREPNFKFKSQLSRLVEVPVRIEG